ncbi:hypothetical protein, partial [Pseudomonas aeruginosa]
TRFSTRSPAAEAPIFAAGDRVE